MDARALARELMTAFQKMRNAPIQGAHTMSMGEKRTMIHLSFETECATPTELSEALGFSTARVANVLNSLEKKGFIQREHGTDDRRKVYVRATEAGRQDCADDVEQAMQGVVCMLESLGEEDAQHYVRITKRIAEMSEKCKNN